MTDAQLGIVVTGAVGVAGIAATVFQGHLVRRHERVLAHDRRRAEAYVEALAMLNYVAARMEQQIGVVTPMSETDDLPRRDIALMVSRIEAFGSDAVLHLFGEALERVAAFWPGHHEALVAQSRVPVGQADSAEASKARMAVADAYEAVQDAVDRLRDAIQREARP